MNKPTWRQRVRAAVTVLLVTTTAWALGPSPVALASPPAEDNPGSAVTADPLPTTQINGVAWDQVIVGDTVYVGGEFTSARPAGRAAGVDESPRLNLMSYNLTTGEMNAWAPQVNGRIRSMAASPDGSRLYIAGAFTAVDGKPRYRVAAFNTADGSLDASFAPIAGSDVFGIAATDTKVYLGGWFGSVNGVARSRLAAVSAADGALLDWAPTADHTVYALGVTQAEDRVVIAGSFSAVNGVTRRSMASLDATTGASYPFAAANVLRNTGNKAANVSLRIVNDKVYSTGYSYGTGNFEGALVADAYTGQIENMMDCHGDTYDAVPMNGVVYSVSHHHMCSNSGGFPEIKPRRYYHADGFTLEAKGTVDRNTQISTGYGDFEGLPTGAMVHWYNDWVPGTFTGVNQAGWTVETAGDYLAIGGEFQSINGVAQQGLVRFATRNVVTSPKMAPVALRSQFTPILQTVTGKVRGSFTANYDRDSETLTYRVIRGDKGEGNPVATMTVASNPWTRPTLTFTDEDVVPGWTYEYYVTVTDPDGNRRDSDPATYTVEAGSDPYASAVGIDGALHYWRLGQPRGTYTAADIAGKRDLTLMTGTTGGQAGALSYGLNGATAFSGTSSGTAGMTGEAIAAPDEFAIEGWFRTTSSRGGKLFGFGNSATGASSTYDRMVYMNNYGRLVFGILDNGRQRTIMSSSSYRDGRYHHVVASLSSSGMKLYVDGNLVASDWRYTQADDYQGYWRVGGDSLNWWSNQGSTGYLAGTIDEVAVYPTELTQAQVRAHVAAASGDSNQAPTAAFTATTGGLTVSLDAGASTDADGTLTAYGWEFGDGGRATGPTATHDYGVPGTYQVTLSVVDDTGAVGKTTQYVTVSAEDETTIVAKDTFNRAGSRWGTAPAGGAWTDSGASTFSTNGKEGVITLSRGGSGPTATLQSVSARDVTIRTDVALDKAPVGGAYLHQLLARVDGSTLYKFTTRIEPSGAVRLIVARKVGATETALKTVTVPDMSYEAGQRLNLRFDVSGDGTTRLDAKVWRAGTTEPGAQVSVTDTTPELQREGAVGITGYSTSAMTSVPLAVTVDDYQVDEWVAPPNQAPTAAMTVATDGLTADIDGSASTDDESIASYAWDFGDGSVATGGPTTSHTYGEAGRYTVTLTVTDAAGLTGTTTREVEVTAPAPAVVAARDTFARTGSGWGTAETGGPWTVNSAAAYATDGEHGTVTVGKSSTRLATLGEVSAKDVSIVTDVALDAAPTGGNFSHQLLARVNDRNWYMLTVRIEATGNLRVYLSRTVDGVETVLKTQVLSAFDYAGGERLNLRFDVKGDTLSGSVWRAGDAEPATPMVTATDATAALQEAGAVAIKEYANSAITNPALLVTVDNLAVEAR